MEQKIKDIFQEVLRVKEETKLAAQIEGAVNLILDCYRAGNKVLACGNGGSFAQAEHLVGELVGRFKLERKPLAAATLASDFAVLTAWSNDYSFDTIFARELEALGRQGDVLIALSTSGNSKNVIEAVEAAKRLNIKCLGLLGRGGGKLRDLVDLALVVPSNDTPRIQEFHLLIIHIICELVEETLFS